MSLTEYEKTQVMEIEAWKKERPSVVSMAVGVVASPIAKLITAIIPQKAIRGALDFSSWTAKRLTDTKDILRETGASSISDLKTLNLEVSDRLADNVHNWAIGIAAVEGGVAGATGLPGIIADIPAIIVIALRTIHKIGVCYGYEAETQEDKDFILAIMSASGANCMEEKVAALTTLQAIKATVMKKTWGTIVATQLGKDASVIAIKNLAKQLGVNLTKRKILQAIPVVGAIVGASVNAWYIKEVGWAARRAFQERWLEDNRKTGVES